jgi:hypothetical protein
VRDHDDHEPGSAATAENEVMEHVKKNSIESMLVNRKTLEI